jgi:hypothetical protein
MVAKILILIFLLFSFCYSGDLSVVAPIVVKNTVTLAWSPSTTPDVSYLIHVLKDGNQLVLHSTLDTVYTMNLENNITEMNRIHFYVESKKGEQVSVPSDTVNYIYNNRPILLGDWNYDGKINGIDAMAFWTAFIKSKAGLGNTNVFDANCDGKINGIDHLYFRTNYGQEVNYESF